MGVSELGGLVRVVLRVLGRCRHTASSCCHVASPQVSICRSSQPLSGFSARCLEDEQMLQAIRKASPGSDFIYVVDTRPKVGVTTLVCVFAAVNHGMGDEAMLPDHPHPLRELHLQRRCFPLHSRAWLPCSAVSVSGAPEVGRYF